MNSCEIYIYYKFHEIYGIFVKYFGENIIIHL